MNRLKDIVKLEKIFELNGSEEEAKKMKKYLRDQYEFLGIKKPKRAVLEKEFIKDVSKKELEDILSIVSSLHNMKYREYMYTAQNLALYNLKKFNIEHIYFLCDLTLIKPWWENTDGYMAIIKRWLKLNPEYIEEFIKKYYKVENFWLRRLAIICQLSLKEDTNFKMLEKAILYNIEDKEFFIQKAIGWALRDYSKYNNKKVESFINSYENRLSSLAKREGSKYLIK